MFASFDTTTRRAALSGSDPALDHVNEVRHSVSVAVICGIGVHRGGATVERSRFYGWQDMAVNADEIYNSASRAVDAGYNCSGTNIYNANAYDQINNITC